MFPFLLFSSILLFSYYFLNKKTIPIDTSHNLLLITAHPDDEFMFFGPTLLNEIRSRINRFFNLEDNDKKITKVHLLCLSNGNYYGDGQLRETELNDACRLLLKSSFPHHISNDPKFSEKIFTWKIINDSELIDSPEVEWPLEHIYSIVEEYIRENKITKVITFDDFGISGHRNHRSIYETVRKLDTKTIRNGMKPLEIWTLESISLFRKYLSVFDIVFTTCQAWWYNKWNVIIVYSLQDYLNLVLSLRKHQSQMLWFRYIYSSTSRYMFINTLNRLTLSE